MYELFIKSNSKTYWEHAGLFTSMTDAKDRGDTLVYYNDCDEYKVILKTEG